MRAARLKQLYNSPVGIVFKIVCSLMILGVFAWSIDLQKLAKAWDRLGPEILLILLLLTLVRNLLGSLRFKILSDLHHKISLMRIMEQYFVASFFNNFLPTALGGDAVRFLMLAKDGITKAHAGTMIVIERLIGFYALIMIALVSSFFWATPEHIYWLVVLIAVGYSAVIVMILGADVHRTWFGRFAVPESIRQALDVYKAQRIRLLWVFMHSLVFQLISIYISYYIAGALGIESSILPFLTLVPLVWFCTMIPIGFGGVGTREVSFAYLFLMVGIGVEQSLLISLGTYLTLLLSGVVGAACFALSFRSNNEALF